MEKDNIVDYIKKAPVTAALLAIIVVYFIVITLNGGTTDTQTLVRFGALFPPLVKEYGQYYRLITSIFIHIGIMHLFFNSYALYIFGTQIEKVMGHKKYLLFLFLQG